MQQKEIMYVSMLDALLFTLKQKRKRKKSKSDRQMNAENRFLVIIFVVRHAANNKQLETNKCLCVLLSQK